MLRNCFGRWPRSIRPHFDDHGLVPVVAVVCRQRVHPRVPADETVQPASVAQRSTLLARALKSSDVMVLAYSLTLSMKQELREQTRSLVKAA